MLAGAMLAAGASAQGYPAKPVRLIVPWAAASGTDLMSRMIAQKLGENLGVQVVVDNRGGAGATIGTEVAAKSAADGYALYIGGSVSLAISPVIYPKVGYDAVRDFAPVSLITRFYNALSVHPSVPAKSVRDLIAIAKAHPGGLVVPSAGAGSTSHLAAELFQSMTGTKVLHVPYKGGGQMVIAVISGEGQVMFSPVSTAHDFEVDVDIRGNRIVTEGRAANAITITIANLATMPARASGARADGQAPGRARSSSVGLP